MVIGLVIKPIKVDFLNTSNGQLAQQRNLSQHESWSRSRYSSGKSANIDFSNKMYLRSFKLCQYQLNVHILIRNKSLEEDCTIRTLPTYPKLDSRKYV